MSDTKPRVTLENLIKKTPSNFFAKIVVVVDDLDVTNQEQMLAGLGAR